MVSSAPVTANIAFRSRFLLPCRGLLPTQTITARPVFERTFREYGLPIAIRTDNGVPFATTALSPMYSDTCVTYEPDCSFRHAVVQVYAPVHAAA
jgi:hypothetical protein